MTKAEKIRGNITTLKDETKSYIHDIISGKGAFSVTLKRKIVLSEEYDDSDWIKVCVDVVKALDNGNILLTNTSGYDVDKSEISLKLLVIILEELEANRFEIEELLSEE